MYDNAPACRIWFLVLRHSLTLTDVYPDVRRRQCAGLALVMFGFLVEWSTVLTLSVFPVLTDESAALNSVPALRRSERILANIHFGRRP
ncbi:MAG TPA: hypothetical protein VG651_11420 [Stellaceae bacterium]|nr:hypothetical protein [Stellaceae bacterium]